MSIEEAGSFAGLASLAVTFVVLVASMAILADATLPTRAARATMLASLVLAPLLALLLPHALALGIALLAPALRARVGGMLGALFAATAAVFAGALDIPLGIAALAMAFWYGSESHTEQIMIAVAGVALAAAPSKDLGLVLRLTFLVVCLGLAMLFRRPLRYSALGAAGQRALASGAAASPAILVALLPIVAVRIVDSGPPAISLALGFLALAVLAAAALSFALLGTALVFSTTNAVRAPFVGALVAATAGVPLLGLTSALLLLAPFLLATGVAATSRLLPRTLDPVILLRRHRHRPRLGRQR